MTSYHETAANPMDQPIGPYGNAELRREYLTPVNTIVGYVELMLEDARRLNLNEALSDLERIATASRQALGLVDSVLPANQSEQTRPLEDEGVRQRFHLELAKQLKAVRRYAKMIHDHVNDLDADALVKDLTVLLDEVTQFLDLLTEGGSGLRLEAPGTFVESALGDDPTVSTSAPHPSRDTRDTGRILVVDDIPSNRLLLSRRLSRDGHDVVEAEGGQQALDILQDGDFDLVLLDLVMPGMDGYQVLRTIKSDLRLRGIRVIMVSGEQETESVLRCIEAGAEDYLPKPVDPVLLNARIGACLERKRWRDRERSYLRQLEEEKKKSESLLLNILPDKIIQRMKQGDKVIADRHDDVTVMFADIVGFTKISSDVSAPEVVATLNRLFSAFDILALDLGVEKIKTIGDAYLVAAGLEDGQEDHVRRVADMALAMIDITNQTSAADGKPWRVRIGIHCGTLVAGVIGTHKFVYDIWGDTVNVASRIESYSQPNRILVSQAVLARLDGRYEFEPRGTTFIRGKGNMETFYLNARRN